MKESCPGSREIKNPYPEDLMCHFCHSINEIWSDEPDMICKSCNRKISRDLPPSCIEWCPAAKECLGIEKYERIIKAKK